MSGHAVVAWSEDGAQHMARWRSEAGVPPPKRVQPVRDTLTAAAAHRMASEGTALLWRSDFHNARQLLQAMGRRAERKPRKAASSPADAFNLHRQAQGQRARVLGSVLVELAPDYSIALSRAPDLRQACREAWGPPDAQRSLASLRELLGLVGAHEWRRKGLEVPALGSAPNDRIHPHYGVFSPVRGEYLDLIAAAPLPSTELAFDIGTGTGVVAAILARRGVQHVVATDVDARAIACARENIHRLGWCAIRRGCLRVRARPWSMRSTMRTAACCAAFCKGWRSTSPRAARAGWCSRTWPSTWACARVTR
jgi:hypothetical protein